MGNRRMNRADLSKDSSATLSRAYTQNRRTTRLDLTGLDFFVLTPLFTWYTKMIIRILVLAILAIAVLGHRIEIDPGEKQCFFEALQPQDKVSEWASVSAQRIRASEGAYLLPRTVGFEPGIDRAKLIIR